MGLNLNAALDGGENPEMLPAVQVLSLEAVKPTFSDFLVVIDDRIRQAQEIQVLDGDSQKMAVALVGEAKRIIKEIDAKKKAHKSYREAKSFLDGLNSFAKGLTEKFEKVVQIADPKVKSYAAAVELERRKAEEAARKAADDLRKKIEAEVEEANRKAREEAIRKAEEEARAAKMKKAEVEEAKRKAEEEARKHEIKAPEVFAPTIPKTDTITRTDTGVSAFAKRPWKFEITDHAAVPREYCIPDNQKIRDAIKMGAREIPGCRIYEDMQMNYKS
jgi:hypothetical protein